MSDFVSTIISGVIGGLIVLLFQKFWDFNDRKKQKSIEELEAKENLIITPQKHLRFVERRIIEHLLPSTSLDKIKVLLGVPDSSSQYDLMTPLNESPIKTHSHAYRFLNADILLTSVDNQSVDTVSIRTKEDKSHPIEYIFKEEPSNVLGEMSFKEEYSMYVTASIATRTARDAFFGVEMYFGRIGHYLNYTVYGFDPDRVRAYEQSNDISILYGGKVDCYCVSRTQGFAPYISFV